MNDFFAVSDRPFHYMPFFEFENVISNPIFLTRTFTHLADCFLVVAVTYKRLGVKTYL